jgi:hypothetical protein
MQRSGIAFRLALYKTASRYDPGWHNLIKGKVSRIYHMAKSGTGYAGHWNHCGRKWERGKKD